MYEDSYALYFEDRAIGQNLPDGYSMKGRYPFETPYDFEFFDNRAVGQSALPMSRAQFFGDFNAMVKPGFTTGGWKFPQEPSEPVSNPVNPTMIYSTDVDKILNGGFSVRHAVIIITIAVVALILLVKVE